MTDLMKLFGLDNLSATKTEAQKPLEVSPEHKRVQQLQQSFGQEGSFMFSSILMSLDAGVPREDLVAGYGEKLVAAAEASRAKS